MKKFLVLMLVMITVAVVGCGSSATTTKNDSNETKKAEAITIKTLNGKREAVELKVPFKPKRVAVMDLGALDIMDNLGLGEHIAGVAKGYSVGYLQKYTDNKNLINLGTIKNANMEALVECNPELIIIGPRLLPVYDELIKIAPVICLAVDNKIGVVESTAQNTKLIASLFGVDDKATGLMASYYKRIKTLADFAKDKTALVCLVNAGGIAVLGNDGRCSIIGKEIGFKNIGVGANISTSTHGNEASFEFLVSANPNYIFVMDRDAAIGTEGAKLAQEVMDNELVKMTSASKNGNIVYLSHSNVWYMAEGGVTALGIMLSDLEEPLLKAK